MVQTMSHWGRRARLGLVRRYRLFRRQRKGRGDGTTAALLDLVMQTMLADMTIIVWLIKKCGIRAYLFRDRNKIF